MQDTTSTQYYYVFENSKYAAVQILKCQIQAQKEYILLFLYCMIIILPHDVMAWIMNDRIAEINMPLYHKSLCVW